MFQRSLIWALAVCVGAVFATEAVGQTAPEQLNPQTSSTVPDMTGWNRVGELRNGQKIVVSFGLSIPLHCVFRGTTDHSILCDEGSFIRGIDHHEFSRDQINWVRTDNFPRDRAIVMVACGGVGAVLGATSPLVPDVGTLKFLNADLLGSIGLGIGELASIPIRESMPGKTIYTQSQAPLAAHPVRFRLPFRNQLSSRSN